MLIESGRGSRAVSLGEFEVEYMQDIFDSEYSTRLVSIH